VCATEWVSRSSAYLQFSPTHSLTGLWVTEEHDEKKRSRFSTPFGDRCLAQGELYYAFAAGA
jgi:hypothetical protein